MAKYKIVTPTGASFTVAGGGYDYEMEPLEGIDAEIVEARPTRRASSPPPRMPTPSMPRASGSARRWSTDCEVLQAIVLGSVGVDRVDVDAATARGMPVTNCPDTFIEEVADHAMTLLLAGFRRTDRAGPHGA